MLSLFKPQRENLFRLYGLLFAFVACTERYVLYEIARTCRETVFPLFYETNFIRVSLLLIPFLLFCCLEKNGVIKTFISNLPFFLFSLAILASPAVQWVYFTVALVTCFLVDKLRKFAVGITLCIIVFVVVMPTLLSGDCSTISSVKANMHTLQTLIERYARENGGRFPDSVKHLKEEATARGYWKNIINPLTGEGAGYGEAFVDASEQDILLAMSDTRKVTLPERREFFGIRFNNGYSEKAWRGKVMYQKLARNSYAIYAMGHTEVSMATKS